MAKPKKPLTSAQKTAKRKRRKEFEIVFINGKQKRIRREPTIDGLPVDEFVRRNADPIFLHRHGMMDHLASEGPPGDTSPSEDPRQSRRGQFDPANPDQLPF